MLLATLMGSESLVARCAPHDMRLSVCGCRWGRRGAMARRRVAGTAVLAAGGSLWLCNFSGERLARASAEELRHVAG